MCVLISHQTLCCSCSGDLPPRLLSSQSFCTSCGSRDSAAFGLFPLPCAFSHFLAAFSFSLDGANSMSRIMLYLLCRSFTRCRCILRWKLEMVSGSKWNHLPYELSQKKCSNERSRSCCRKSSSSLCSTHHAYHFFMS